MASQRFTCGTCLVATLTAVEALPLPQGEPAVPAPVVVNGVTINGPAPPLPPETIARDAQGRATLRAVPISERMRIDGELDENVYRIVPSMSGFVQTDPEPGAPATEQTDVWIFFDHDTLYVGARCWDSQPEARWVANEMRRDSMNIVRNENLAVYFDTFFDRRNAFLFEISPIGGIYDAYVTNERRPATSTTTRCGIGRWGASSTDGPPRWPFRSGRSAINPARRRSGASTSGGRCAGRTKNRSSSARRRTRAA